MKASDLFIRCLENEGVEYIFGVPGEENADIMISLLDSKIRFVVCRHEQAAAFICDLYGRLTGRPAACLGTLGPGATNLLTGVGQANMDRSPLIVLTGQASTTRIHKESHQAMDLVKLFETCVKWGTTISHPDSIPEIIRKAFRIATSDKWGACHIDLPENVAKMPTLARPIPPAPVARSAPRAREVSRAADLIMNARFPILMTGNGTLRNGASEQLRAFAKATGIPVVNTFMGKGAFPPSDPQYLFTVGLGARDWPAVAIENADCVLAVGFDMVEYHPKSWNKGNDKTLIHIDQSAAEIDENYRTSCELVGDIGLCMDALRDACQGMKKPAPSLYSECREKMLEDFRSYEEDQGFPVKPQRALADVRKVLDDRDIVISDVGAHKMWVARYLHTEEPNTIHISNGFCSMGGSMPGAIGAKMVFPDRRVLAICGDGGFMMNIQDLETAVREKVNIVVLLWEDSRYGLIKWKQEAQFGKYSHIDFTNPDWMKLADAFGMAGFKVEAADELLPKLEAAFAAGRPALVVMPVDYNENMKLTASLKQIPQSEVCDALGKMRIFAGLPKAYRNEMAQQMEEREVAAGTVVFNQGDRGDAVFLIHAGEVKVERDGAEVARLGKGQSFGEVAALSDAPRTATVTVTQDACFSVLDGDDFRSLLLSQPELSLSLARNLADWMAKKS